MLTQDVSGSTVSESTLSPLVIVQLTDTHLFADPGGEMLHCCTHDSLARVLEAVEALPALDVILLTGDLSQDDSPQSYQRLGTLLAAFQVPVYWLPGNHDQNTAATKALLSQPPFCEDKTFECWGWRVLLLNTMLSQQVQGRLSAASLDWLEQRLSENSQQPTLIALHHHPLPIGSAWMDGIALENPEDLLAVIDRHPQVKLVLNGHIHQDFAAHRQGVDYFGTPSTCVQFKPQTPQLVIDDVGPGFREICLYPDGRHMTRVVRVSSASSPAC